MEDEIDVGQQFGNDYERTKVEAETLIHAATRAAGGFLDTAYLVRIDAPQATLTALGHKIGKSSTKSLGAKFFSFAPYWWPKSMSDGGKIFQTLDQPFSTYPGDGTYYTMLVDASGTRAWIHVFHGF
jgi:hypothetical protein